jgi:hypothetical protein
MNHAFTWLAPKYRWIAFGLLLIATLSGLAVLSIQGKELKTGLAPFGAISLQLAWSDEQARNIIGSWKGLESVAYSQQYYDFVFLIIYPLFLSLSVAVVSEYGSGPISTMGAPLSWIVLITMPLDAMENTLILRMLHGGQPSFSQLTTVLATLKWALVLSVFGYWFAALPQLISRSWVR